MELAIQSAMNENHDEVCVGLFYNLITEKCKKVKTFLVFGR